MAWEVVAVVAGDAVNVVVESKWAPEEAPGTLEDPHWRSNLNKRPYIDPRRTRWNKTPNWSPNVRVR